jgi:hypothetical protein
MVGPDLSATKIMEGTADVFAAGATVAHNVYAREQKALAEALAKKKEIADTVSAGALASEYEEASRDLIVATQEEFRDSPDKAPEAIIPRLNSLSKDYQKRAGENNSEVELHAVKAFQSQNLSATREMGSWAQMRLTEQTKEKLFKIRNGLINNARRSSLPELQGVIASNRVNPQWEAALGKKASHELDVIEGEMYNAWGEEQAKVNPVGLLGVLRDKGNIFSKNLSPDDYSSLENKARMGMKGLENTNMENELAAASKADRPLVEAFQSGKMTGAYITAEFSRIDGAKLKAAQDLQNGKITPKMKEDIWKIQDRRLRLVKIVESYHYLNTKPAYDLSDDEIPEELAVKLAKFEETKNTPEGVAELRIANAEALRDGKITRTAAATLNKDLRLVEEAMEKDAIDNSGYLGIAWTSRQVGNKYINEQLADTTMSPRNANRVRMQYLKGFDDFIEREGSSPNRKQAQMIAKDALNNVLLRAGPSKK